MFLLDNLDEEIEKILFLFFRLMTENHFFFPSRNKL